MLTSGYLAGLARAAGSNAELTWVRTEVNSLNPPLSTLFSKSSTSGPKSTRQYLLNSLTIDATPRTFKIATYDPTAVVDGCCNVSQATRNWMINSLPAYGATLTGTLSYDSSYFAFKDMCQRLQAGGGSLGVLRFYVLLEGPTTGQDDDIVLDVKQVPGSDVLVNMDPTLRAFNKAIGTPAQISMRGYRRLVNYADNFLGYLYMNASMLDNFEGLGNFTALGTGFSVRERSPNKNSYGFDAGQDLTSNDLMNQAAYYMGDVMATAHSRADNDTDPTLIPYDFDSNVYAILNANFSGWQALVLQVAQSYVGQANADYESFLSLYNSGAFNGVTTSPTPPTSTVSFRVLSIACKH